VFPVGGYPRLYAAAAAAAASGGPALHLDWYTTLPNAYHAVAGGWNVGRWLRERFFRRLRGRAWAIRLRRAADALHARGPPLVLLEWLLKLVGYRLSHCGVPLPHGRGCR
jgi:hypothetical protein